MALNPLDLDSSIEQAANALGPMSENRQSLCKRPAVMGFTSDEGTDGSSRSKRTRSNDDETESEQEVQPSRKTGLG